LFEQNFTKQMIINNLYPFQSYNKPRFVIIKNFLMTVIKKKHMITYYK